VSIDFNRLVKPIDINRLIFIHYIDYIDWFSMIDFHRLGTPGYILFDMSRISCYVVVGVVPKMALLGRESQIKCF